MYRRAAYPIANMLADIPFSATRVLLYNIVIYFMAHLDRSAGGFWTYHLMVYLTFLVMQAFFRAFGLIFHDFDTAFRISVIFFLHIMQYAGLWVPLAAMKRWLFWIVSTSLISIVGPSWLTLLPHSTTSILSPMVREKTADPDCPSVLNVFVFRMGRYYGQRVHAHHFDV